MRFNLFFLIIAINVSACTFQVEVETPQPPASIPSSFPPLSEAATATLPPPPTFTPAPPPSAVIIPTFPPPTTLPIHFSANATWQNVMGSIDAGSSQTYSLNALQGQIMSVSILAENPETQGTFLLEIKGQDSVVLCPLKDEACYFWRGVLPSTQGYLITVVPQVSGAFTMRIAINPPGSANQYFHYADKQGNLVLAYSDAFAPAHFTGPPVYKFEPELVLEFIDSQQYVQTNLNEAYFLLDSSNDPQQTSTCTQPVSFGGLETGVGEVPINEITFTRSEVQGVAAGNIYEQVYYRVAQNGICYEVVFFTHFGNIGAYIPGSVKEFDHSALLHEFEGILSTIVIK